MIFFFLTGMTINLKPAFTDQCTLSHGTRFIYFSSPLSYLIQATGNSRKLFCTHKSQLNRRRRFPVAIRLYSNQLSTHAQSLSHRYFHWEESNQSHWKEIKLFARNFLFNYRKACWQFRTFRFSSTLFSRPPFHERVNERTKSFAPNK